MILFFEPIYKEKIWGGEYWGISAHENGQSIVKNGEFKGLSLKELWDNNIELFGNLQADKFPLLVKVIDAKEDLSVQVHPDDDYARVHENNELGKTECWYILDAKDDADIIYGVNSKSKNELNYMIDSGNWNDLLNTRKIKKGDFLFIPSGMVHAIKSGTKLLEIQQNSDTTYRLYDYDRLDQEGNLREIHIDKSKDVIKLDSKDLREDFIVEKIIGGLKTILLKSEYFDVYKYDIKDRVSFNNNEIFTIINVIEGSGVLRENNNVYDLEEEDYILITADTKEFEIDGNVSVIMSNI